MARAKWVPGLWRRNGADLLRGAFLAQISVFSALSRFGAFSALFGLISACFGPALRFLELQKVSELTYIILLSKN